MNCVINWNWNAEHSNDSLHTFSCSRHFLHQPNRSFSINLRARYNWLPPSDFHNKGVHCLVAFAHFCSPSCWHWNASCAPIYYKWGEKASVVMSHTFALSPLGLCWCRHMPADVVLTFCRGSQDNPAGCTFWKVIPSGFLALGLVCFVCFLHKNMVQPLNEFY